MTYSVGGVNFNHLLVYIMNYIESNRQLELILGHKDLRFVSLAQVTEKSQNEAFDCQTWALHGTKNRLNEVKYIARRVTKHNPLMSGEFLSKVWRAIGFVSS